MLGSDAIGNGVYLGIPPRRIRSSSLKEPLMGWLTNPKKGSTTTHKSTTPIIIHNAPRNARSPGAFLKSPIAPLYTSL